MKYAILAIEEKGLSLCIYYRMHCEDQVPHERVEEAKFLIAPSRQLPLRLKNVCQVAHSTPTMKEVRPTNFE
jgi:hypothetical protein